MNDPYELINNEAVCTTAPATPGLLTTWKCQTEGDTPYTAYSIWIW